METESQRVAELKSRGVLVIPITLSSPFDLDTFLGEQREFINPDGRQENGLVMGGFGAYGHPSSFHHPEIRRIRSEVYHQIKPFLTQLRETEERAFIEMLFDRFSLRRKGTKTTREAWHRDVSPKKQGDTVFGGWINLDTEGDQYFSCIPSSHSHDDSDLSKPDGFVKVDVASVTKNAKTTIRIPPHHLIIFYQDILHEIYPTLAKKDSIRLYIGWRITDYVDPLFQNTQEIMDTQATPYLPSGQTPPLFSKSHLCFHKQKVVNFVSNIKPVYRSNAKRLYGGFPVELRSLMEISLMDSTVVPFPFYSQEETYMYYPNV